MDDLSSTRIELNWVTLNWIESKPNGNGNRKKKDDLSSILFFSIIPDHEIIQNKLTNKLTNKQTNGGREDNSNSSTHPLQFKFRNQTRPPPIKSATNSTSQPIELNWIKSNRINKINKIWEIYKICKNLFSKRGAQRDETEPISNQNKTKQLRISSIVYRLSFICCPSSVVRCSVGPLFTTSLPTQQSVFFLCFLCFLVFSGYLYLYLLYLTYLPAYLPTF